MESYNQMGEEDSSDERGNFPVPYLTSSLIAPPHHHMINMNMGHLVHLQHHHTTTTAVKNEARFHNYPLMLEEEKENSNSTTNKNTSKSNNNISNSEEEAMKAKIIAHPHYSNLLKAYMDCQKVGAPPEVSARLTEYETRQPAAGTSNSTSKDPELDQFMEAYYDMLVKYREELSRPVEEAMEFMRRIESQLNLLTNGRARFNFTSDERSEGIGNSEAENSGGERRGELKKQLLKKYRGYLSSLKQELSKKKKKGKLPKEARQKLLSWWELHYKWPYPSESEKLALAEASGLDQKQINNWFINQRKRHWNPSQDMHFIYGEGIIAPSSLHSPRSLHFCP